MSENQSGAVASQSPVSESTENQSTEDTSSENEVEGQEAQVEAIENDPSLTKKEKVQAKAKLKSLKIKYNGKEYDEELPFEIEDDPKAVEYMKKHLQMSKLGQSKAQEYSQLEGEVKNFFEELRKNPRKVLSDPTINVDVKRMVTEMIEEEISNSQKSPEQLERENIEKELKSLKEEREREKQDFNKRELERLQEQELVRYDMLITKALEGNPDLPKSEYVVKRMADYMLLGLEQGYDVTPEDVVKLVRNDMKTELTEMFKVMPEDVIEQLIGKDVFNRVRKKRVAAAKEVPATAKSITDTGKTAPKAKESEKISYKDFFGI